MTDSAPRPSLSKLAKRQADDKLNYPPFTPAEVEAVLASRQQHPHVQAIARAVLIDGQSQASVAAAYQLSRIRIDQIVRNTLLKCVFARECAASDAYSVMHATDIDRRVRSALLENNFTLFSQLAGVPLLSIPNIGQKGAVDLRHALQKRGITSDDSESKEAENKLFFLSVKELLAQKSIPAHVKQEVLCLLNKCPGL